MKPLDFDFVAEIDRRNGRIMAVYMQFRKGDVAETREIVEGKAFADYDRKGVLLGVELLAPCRFAAMAKLSDEEPIREFVRNKLPKPSAWSPAIAACT